MSERPDEPWPYAHSTGDEQLTDQFPRFAPTLPTQPSQVSSARTLQPGKHGRRRRTRSGRPRPPTRPTRPAVLATLILVGLGAVTGGGIMLGRELTRTATNSDIKAAVSLEVASRWERLPAGAIFPPSIRYTDAEAVNTTARRVGIAPPSRCAAALDRRVAAAVNRAGCTVVLRATYVDASGTLISSVGVAVMPSARAARQASALVSPSHTSAGIRSVSFSATIANEFGNAQRQVFDDAYLRGPYLFFATGGYADGRISKSRSVSTDLNALDSGVMIGVGNVLTRVGAACKLKDIRC